MRQRGDADHAQHRRARERPLGRDAGPSSPRARGGLSTGHDDGGTEPQGWARGLEQLGAGGYEVVVEPSRTKAILRARDGDPGDGPAGRAARLARRALVGPARLRGRPPTRPRRGPFEVTHLYVSDPWYPRVSSIWGASRGAEPGRITPKQLEEDYLPWRRPTGRYPGMDGQYVLVLPVDEDSGAA